MSNTPVARVGNDVTYCHEHYVGRVKSYDGVVVEVHDDGLCDIQVDMGYQTIVKAIRYDPDGKPSSWHWREH
jgi:hypothetical protein